MAVHGCIKPVLYENGDDSDDDAPAIFRRTNTPSKQSQLNSSSKKSPLHHDQTQERPTSNQSSRNGESTSLQKNKVTSKAKVSTEKAATVSFSSRASTPSQSKHPSKSGLSNSNANSSHTKKTCDEVKNSDDSDDGKPLSSKFLSASVAVQKSVSTNPSKTVEHPLEHEMESENEDKMTSNANVPTEKAATESFSTPSQTKHPSKSGLSNSNANSSHTKKSCDEVKISDDKLLSSKFRSASVAIQKSVSTNPSKTVEHPLEHKMESKNEYKMVLDKSCDKSEEYDDSDDKIPLSAKFSSSLATRQKVSTLRTTKVNEPSIPTSTPSQKNKASIKDSDDDSEDEKPLLSKLALKSTLKSESEKKPLASKLKENGTYRKESSSDLKPSKGINKRPSGDINNSTSSSVKKAKLSDTSVPGKVKSETIVKKEEKADDNDHITIAQKMKKTVSSNSQSSTKVVIKKTSSSLKKESKKMKKTMKNSKYSKSMKVPPGSGEGKKWTTLEHNGVIFPPPYKPHGIKMLYNGQPVDLTPVQEEVATMFAVMKDSDYATKTKFIENFMNDWWQILGKNHIIKKFELCDFTPIYEWHLAEKEKKKQMTSEEKKALKEEKLMQEEKYMWAVVDGVKEKVGNFRVEPPGLFRGRGEHPKMGKLKRRIRPKDITINIGKDAPVPECQIPGERWKEVKHDNTVTWLAFWNDPINPKEFKYVFLAASSSLKGQSDKEKYEKARLLKDYIQGIRATYTRDFTSKDTTKRQIAVATYLIDKLALRAGNEKDDDEADTVGCCTLKVENVTCVPPSKLQFDFLGKDSVRYFNTVEVELPVYKAIGEFQTAKKSDGKKKAGGDDLFDMLDTNKLNAHLKELMPGLTAKVFRTYNASITLDDMLNKETKDGTLPEKIVVYQSANKEVAIICNHQRSVSKSHDAQMSRLNEKIDELKAQMEELKVDLSRARKGKPPLKDKDGKPKKTLSPEVLEKKLSQVGAKIEKMELDKKIKEDLKTVALGTSKINYLDPRISVAWCKRHEVPIEKIFNKSLLAKFAWAMDVDPSYRF